MSTPRVTTTLLKPAQDPARVLVVGAGLGTGVQALWSLAAQQLPEDTVVVGYDLPGHGASEPHAEPFSMAELADAVVAAVQALQEDGTVPADLPVHFAGVSLNGCVALQLALDHADTVSGVAVICSAAKIGEAGSWRERAELVERAGTPTLVEGSAQRWFADGFIAAHPERTTGLLHTLQEADRHSYARLCEALADFDVRGRLGEIAVPVLTIHGVADQVRRRGLERRPPIRVGTRPDQRGTRPGCRVLAPRPPQPHRPVRARVLPLPRPQARRLGRAGPRRRREMGDRGDLPNGERADRAGPLPSPAVHRLVPAHHALHARPRLPHRHPVKKGARGDKDGDLVELSLPEIRHLIAALVLNAPADPARVLHRSRWRRKHQHTARRHHYLRRGHTP